MENSELFESRDFERQLGLLSQVERVINLSLYLAKHGENGIGGILDTFPTSEVAKDLGLVVRSTNSAWAEHAGVPKTPYLYDRYGTFLVPAMGEITASTTNEFLASKGNTFLLSQPNWDSLSNSLINQNFGAATVLTPELITFAGQPLERVVEARLEIEGKITQMLDFSKTQTAATFVLGSPHFVEGKDKPYNGALIIKNGDIVGVGHKRLGTPGEIDFFELDPEDPATTIEGNSLLVCKDLLGAEIATTRKWMLINYVKQFTKDDQLAEKFERANFMNPDDLSLMLISCWGIGISRTAFQHIVSRPGAVNEFYFMNLEMITKRLLENRSNLERIVVCDRAPSYSTDEDDGFAVSTKPFNSVFFRNP